MKDAICLTLFIAKALCFVAFIIVLKPAAISVIQASVKPAHCETLRNARMRFGFDRCGRHDRIEKMMVALLASVSAGVFAAHILDAWRTDHREVDVSPSSTRTRQPPPVSIGWLQGG